VTAKPMPTPLPGMTVTPDKFGTDAWEILLGGFWASLCEYLISQPEARAAFKADTGKNLDSLVNRSQLDEMIDNATGYQSEIMAAWCDWVTVNHWGVEAAVIPINKGEDCTVGASSKQNETQAKYKGKAQ